MKSTDWGRYFVLEKSIDEEVSLAWEYTQPEGAG